MSEEELHKKMEFIVEWQAKFAADMEMMKEQQAAVNGRLSDGLVGLMDVVGNLARHQLRTEENVNSLTTTVDSLTTNVVRLEQAQARTEEKLSILIHVVERYFGGNGPSPSPA